jgi:AcrR family transcriptional regulator
MLHLRNLYDARVVDDALVDATDAVLMEHGLQGVTLERVAARAGVSRVTLWRRGVTTEALVTGLLQRLADDYQAEFWPILDSAGKGLERLSECIQALFAVADRHLDLLAISDEAFHWAAERCTFPDGWNGFLTPFLGALRQGSTDGSMVFPGRPADAADVVFNTACWGYVHLRRRHVWTTQRAQSQVLALLLDGMRAARNPRP